MDNADAVRAVIYAAVGDLVPLGRAIIADGENDFGRFIAVTPAASDACAFRVYLDSSTVSLGADAHGFDVAGSWHTQLDFLRELADAIVDGQYRFEYRQASRGRSTVTELVGTFELASGPWSFTRRGAEPRNALGITTYAPY